MLQVKLVQRVNLRETQIGEYSQENLSALKVARILRPKPGPAPLVEVMFTSYAVLILARVFL